MIRFRLMALLVMGCAALFSLKLMDIMDSSRHGISENTAFVSKLHAASSEGEKATEEKPAEGEHAAGDAKEGEHGGEHGAEGAAPKEPETQATITPVGEVTDPSAASAASGFSDTELNILQTLVQRRKRLEQWEKDIQTRQQVLDITQNQIDKKLTELKNLKAEVEDLLRQYNEKEDAKIASLVKIYENMKPKDAAEIFGQLDTPTLLQVIGKMSERKVAPILAGMDPKRAKDVTSEFAARRRLQ